LEARKKYGSAKVIYKYVVTYRHIELKQEYDLARPEARSQRGGIYAEKLGISSPSEFCRRLHELYTTHSSSSSERSSTATFARAALVLAFLSSRLCKIFDLLTTIVAFEPQAQNSQQLLVASDGFEKIKIKKGEKMK